MKKLFTRFSSRHSITTQLNTLILPVLLVMMVLFGEICVGIYRQVITSHVKKELQLLTESSASYLDSFLTEAARQSDFIYSSQSLRDILQQVYEREGPVSIETNMDIYEDVIDPLFTGLGDPRWYANHLYLFNAKLFVDMKYVRNVEQLPVGIDRGDLLQGGSGAYWTLAESYPLYPNFEPVERLLCYCRVLYSDNRSPLAILSTEIRLSVLEPVVAKAVLEQTGGSYSWQTTDGDVIFQSEDFDRRRWTAKSQILLNDSYLEAGYSDALIDQQAQLQHAALLMLTLLMAALSFLLIYLVSRLALARIRRVARKYACFKEGEPSPALEGQDEAALLDQSFTAMYRKYRDNVDAYYQLKSTYHVMEYQMLMSKINPHFLYNTLSAIRWSVLWDNKQDASEAVDHMVAFYRGTLSQGKDVVALRTELSTLQSYLRLQAYAYSRSIAFETDISPETESLFVQKFLLQPIVENAVMHGTNDDECHIRLEARVKENTLLLSVWNGGEPMDRQIMDRLNGFNEMDAADIPGSAVPQNEKGSYGVFNVIARIRLLYGGPYGLWYSRPEKGGTLAEFAHPVLKNADPYPAAVKKI